MLVITRRIGEKIIINNHEITISFLDLKGSQMRIGIEAPKHIPVHRGEIQDLIDKEKSYEELRDFSTTIPS